MRILDDRPNSASRNWLVSGVVWLCVGTTFGLLGGIEMAAPDFLGGIPALVFGRVRPIHVDTVVFGFLSMVLLGAGLYFTPKLLSVPLWSEKLANLSMWGWNFAVLLGLITLMNGQNQGHEYAEYMPYVSGWIVASLILLAFNVFKTISSRNEPLIYVSIWYFGAAMLWTITQFLFLGGIGKSFGIYDAVWTWFYGHNIFGLWITPLATGAAYYVIPREVRRPVYSHTLSLMGFWLLVTDYAPTGVHHLLQAPVPQWQKEVSIVHSVLLLIPVYIFLSNIWLTMRGRMGRIEESISLKWVFAGTVFYFIVSTQGSFQSLMYVQRLTHFTQWVVGHSHIGLLGFAGFISIGVLYNVLPQILGRPLYSAKLANAQYWLFLLGTAGFMIFLTAAGLIQGSAWLNGEDLYRVLPEWRPYMTLRGISGVFIVVGAYMMLYNVLKTVTTRTAVFEVDEPAVTLREIAPAVEES